MPAIRRVHQAGHATVRQIFRALGLPENKNKWDVFQRRMRQLAAKDYVKLIQIPDLDSLVLSLGAEGAAMFRGTERTLVDTGGRGSREGRSDQVRHDVELFEMYLQLRRSKVVTGWQFEPEIRADNNYTTFGYAKDYDAIIDIRMPSRSARIAFEYERTPKTTTAYEHIGTVIGRDRRIDGVVYGVNNPQMESYLLHGLRNAAHRVFVTNARQFAADPDGTPLVDARQRRQWRLLDAFA